MKKQQGIHKSFYITLIIFIIFIMVIVVLVSQANNPLQNLNSSTNPFANTPQSNTYTSKNLSFSIETPVQMKISEQSNYVILKDAEGEIIISRIGTNFDNLDDYLEDLGRKNNFEVTDKNSILIDNKPAIVGFIKNKKNYFFYPSEWVVYTLSTSTPSLYDELDQVARSFQYLP